MCFIPEIADIVNSGQTQRKYKSGAAERKGATAADMGLRQA